MKNVTPQSLWEAAKRGAWLGLKWTTYFMGPLVVLMVIVAGGMLSYAVGQIGLGCRGAERLAQAFYLSSCLWGCIGGIVISCVTCLYRRRIKVQPRE